FSLHYTDDTKQKKRSNLLETLNDWYQKLLEEKRDAMEYLHERGIYASSIERFGIGYAPTSPETLRFLEQRKLSSAEAIEQGAIGRGEEGRLFARFIERITFPIHSTSGAIVGFGGRTITGHQAKYVNSSQSAIFNKSRLLYAYHLAREAIYRRREIIVTEGYLDVVMLHQAGFTHAVATLGTALTTEHLPLLRKGEPKIFLAYDGDKAGRAAAFKASKLLSGSGFDGGVILFEGGLDPADMIKNGQIEALNALLHRPIPFAQFTLDEIISQYDLQDFKAKETALHEAAAFIKNLSPLMQEDYKRYIAPKLPGIRPEMVPLGTTQQKTQSIVKTQFGQDLWELSLIKTIIERPNITNSLLDFLDPSMLQYHSIEFKAVLQNETNNSRLSEIVMNNDIRVFDGDEGLKAELMTFLSAHYTRELKKVSTQNTVSFDQKSYLIRQFRDKIERLKRGELVPLS
ncbi:DNA primase, partial [Sulfuricurvum sp.]|uniref:DNA primase n=1 Tax=Sulfuricurvum sp. TaxID=2025608 RepID=UPI003BB76789